MEVNCLIFLTTSLKNGNILQSQMILGMHDVAIFPHSVQSPQSLSDCWFKQVIKLCSNVQICISLTAIFFSHYWYQDLLHILLITHYTHINNLLHGK